jgi:two-component sensor histidine kinase
MLKEVHHRVKNNLQVIASLLNLQAHYVRDARAFGMFKESQQRVQAMALIHERLYHADDATRIDFTDYTRTLGAHLMSAYSPGSAAIALQLHVDNITLGIDTAIPCGLIIHELVANALKHAFPAGKAGEIRLVLRASGAARFMLLVSDNGIGFPPSLDFRHTASLGLRLVHTLTEQLEGTIELQSNGGTTFTITFAELTYTQRG